MTIRGDEDRPPPEYTEYLFCKHFRCLPKDLEEMDAATVQRWIYFLNAEAESGKLKDMQRKFYGE